MQLELNFNSEIINTNVNISVYYPEPHQKSVTIVWLFPGLGADKKDIILNRQVKNVMKLKTGFVFVAVDGYRSFYQNMKNGYQYYDLINKEIAAKLIGTLGLKVVNEKIIGISMGGYGAFYHVLQNPGRYDEVISIAGSVNIVERNKVKQKADDFIGHEWRNIFGSELTSEQDLFTYPQTAFPKQVKLYCGFDDHLFEHNNQFVEHLQKIGVNPLYETSNGAHNYDYFISCVIDAVSKIEE